MPDSTKEALILGRPGGGRDGAPGGLCFYSGGNEYRVQPGDVVDLPLKVYAQFLADGFIAGDPDPEPESEPEDENPFDFDADESEEDDF